MVGLCGALDAVTKGRVCPSCPALCSVGSCMIGHLPCLLAGAAQPEKEGVIRVEKLVLLLRKVCLEQHTGSLCDHAVGVF